jgi:hypothetical protein
MILLIFTSHIAGIIVRKYHTQPENLRILQLILHFDALQEKNGVQTDCFAFLFPLYENGLLLAHIFSFMDCENTFL